MESLPIDPSPLGRSSPFHEADQHWDAGDLNCGMLILELRRRLRDQGTSVAEMKDEIRRDWPSRASAWVRSRCPSWRLGSASPSRARSTGLFDAGPGRRLASTARRPTRNAPSQRR